MERVAIYCRLSEEDRDKKNEWDESESIQNQKSMLIHYCIEKGWEIYKIYCDEDYSGADRKRPEWNRLISDCERGKIDIVLCKTQSRFSRDMEIIERYLHDKFLEWHVRFVSIVDHADTQANGNKKARQINGLINEWYLEDLSDNIKRTLTYKKKNGQWTGSFAPYGYQRDPKNKNHFVVDSVASEVVKDIYRMFASGMGYIAIAQCLNKKGIPNPTLYKRLNGSNYKTNESRITSGIWTDNTIYFILRQEIYLGVLVQGKTHSISYKNQKRIMVPKEDWIRCPNTHVPIIDKTLWNAVQQRLSSKARSSYANDDNKRMRHALSNKVYCAECGNIMYKTSSKGANGRYEYLKCRTTKTTKSICSNIKFIRLDHLQDLILSKINEFLSRYYNPKLVQLPQQAQFLCKQDALTQEKKQLENQIAKQNKLSFKIYMDRLEGVINEEQYFNYQNECKLKQQNYQIRKKVIRKELSELKTNQKIQADQIHLLQYQKQNILTHEIVNEFISAVYVGGVQNGQREITIKWNFSS